ncbi:hypothetical protein [Herbidospora sp. RD11066]
MIKRIATALVAAAAMSASALVGAAPALANPGHGHGHHDGPDPKITGIVINPNPVVLKGKWDSEVVSITVKGVDIKHAKIVVDHKGSWGRDDWDGHGWDDKSADSTTSDSSDEEKKKPEWKPQWFSYSESVRIDTKDPKGFYSVKVFARGFDGKLYSSASGFTVKHDTYNPPKPPKGPKATRIVDFNAGPEPVKKGRNLTLTGQLQVAQCYGDWYYDYKKHDRAYVELDGSVKPVDDGWSGCYDSRDYWHGWYKLGWQDIDVYFLPAGSHKWKYVKTIDTNPNGSFYTKVKAWGSGTWGVRYDGSHGFGSSEASDYVKVVK